MQEKNLEISLHTSPIQHIFYSEKQSCARKENLTVNPRKKRTGHGSGAPGML
jgi:hypothetical protein